MRIQHNIMAMSAYRNYTNNVSAMKKNLEKLSSGYKINRAGDDAAGLAISEKMRAQITGLETAQKNAKDGISLVQTAEGALTEVHDMLNRMVELATQSANGTYEDTTDRKQLQKEVDQLLSEINRIADSSNFNGINLLDGTLGMNTDAFDVGAAVKGEAAVAGNALGSEAFTVPTKTTASPGLHFTAGGKQEDPSFSISVGDYAIKTGAGAAGSVTVNFAGTSVKATFASSGTYTTKQIADAIAAKFNSTIENAADTNKAQGKVGGLAFEATVADDGRTINFNYVGVLNANGTKVSATAALTASKASTFNNVYGGAVTIGEAGVDSKTGKFDHNILNAHKAVAGADPVRAGMDITLKAPMLANGNILTIDGQKFEFKSTASYTQQDKDAILIDVSEAGSDAAKLREAALQMSNKTAGNFEIQTKTPNTGVIHIEQTAESFKNGAASGKTYNYDELKAVVSANAAGTPAKNAGTILDINAANVKEGNVLTIGTGSNAKTVKFTGAENTASKVAAKIKADTGYDVEISADKTGIASKYTDRLIVRATAAAATAGPRVLGKGLTLQIGDTSDSWNQLNVAVQDMHAASLGIDGLKINTEESAQMAIQKIKDAINTVSDVRGTLGATQNRLDHTINNLSVMTENIQDAESTIRDVDVAEEMMAYTKNNILIQSAQAMLAQANQVPQGVLQLLG